jgi:hypothetical protein
MSLFFLMVHLSLIILSVWIIINKKKLIEKNPSWVTAIKLAPFGLIASICLLINDIVSFM